MKIEEIKKQLRLIDLKIIESIKKGRQLDNSTINALTRLIWELYHHPDYKYNVIEE